MSVKATEEAIQTLDKGIALAQAAGDLQEMHRLQQNLIDTLLFRHGNPKAALRVAQEARALAQKSGDKRSEGALAWREGMAQAHVGNQKEGIKLARQAQELLQESHCPGGESQCLQFITQVHSDLGEIDAALESAEERLAVLREVNDLSAESDAMLQLARLHVKDENFEEAQKLAEEAHKLGKQDRSSAAEIHALRFLIEICIGQIAAKPLDEGFSKRLVDRAVRSSNEALKLAGKAENHDLRAAVLYSRSEALVFAGRPKAALRDVKEASKIYESMGNHSSFGRCLLVSGNLRHRLDEIEQGVADLDTAERIAQDSNDFDLTDEVARVRRAIEEEERKQKEEEAAPQVSRPDPEVNVSQAPDIVEQKEQASAAVPVSKGLQRDHVRSVLAVMVKDAIAGDDDADDLWLDSAFMEAGIDSLSSVSLTSMVSKEFQMQLSPSLVFDFPTLRAMEEHIMEESQKM